jgi:hypothetical protein
MALVFNDDVCELINRRLKDCIPLGLYKIWFRVKNSCLEDLGNLLGYSDKDFEELVLYSSLSSQNNKLFLETWEKKLYIKVEVRKVKFHGEQFNTVRFGESIAVGDSPQALIPANNTVNDGIWQNKTYLDREIMDIFISDYREKYSKSYHVRNCSRLPPHIVRLIECRKHQRRTEPEEDGEDAIGEERNYLSVDRTSAIDVAPHLTSFNANYDEFEKEEIFIEELRKHQILY